LAHAFLSVFSHIAALTKHFKTNFLILHMKSLSMNLTE